MNKLQMFVLSVVSLVMLGCGEKTSSTQTEQAPPPLSQVQQQADRSYVALLQCGGWSPEGIQHINIAVCFSSMGGINTKLELKNGQNYGSYEVYDLMSIGREGPDGFRIELQPNFELTVQNAFKEGLLGLKIIGTETGKLYFEKQVKHYGVIKVSN